MSELTEKSTETSDSHEQTIVQLTVNLPEEPGNISFPTASDENMAEISQTLNGIPATRRYTSFDLVFNGEKLSPSTQMSEILDPSSEEAAITLKEAPYTERSARDHVTKVREMASLELPSFYGSLYDFTGVAAGSSTYESLELEEIRKEEEEPKQEKKENSEEKKADTDQDTAPKKEAPRVSDEEKAAIDSHLEEIINEKGNVSEFAASSTLRLSPSLKSLYISAWTPASQPRKLKGDLFYLYCRTLEDETFHITAHVSGFFVNRSSAERFDGEMRTFGSAKRISNAHSLFTLLKALSPKFGEQLNANDAYIAQNIAETYMLPSNCFLSNPWLVKKTEKIRPDLARSQESYIHGGLDGADLQKDWNADFQELRELGKTNIQESITREQLLNETSFNFTVAAIKGAIAIVNGEVTPMNPEDEPSQFIYLRNGIFYSNPLDSTGQFSKSGGDEAARVAALHDLAGIKCLNRLDVEGVSHLMTTVIDYYGHRIVCQTPVPGIFNSTPEAEKKIDSEDASSNTSDIVAYGALIDGDRLVYDDEIAKKFIPIGEAFHIEPHKVWNKDGKQSIDVVTSAQTKGLKGKDGRKYIIDLYRTTPLDIEFIEKNYDASNPETSYPHRETTLRHEAVEEWWRRKVSAAVKEKADKVEEENAERKAAGETVGESDDKKPTIDIETAAFTLNPDAFSLTKAPTDELAKKQTEDENRVREASKFIKDVLILEFLADMEKNNVYIPLDGSHLVSMLHKQGINVRYLGMIAKMAKERKGEYLKKQAAGRAEISKINEVVAVEEEKAEAKLRVKAQERAKIIREAITKGEKPLEEEETKEEKKQREEEEKTYTDHVNTADVAATLDALLTVAITEMIARGTKHYLRKQLNSVPLSLVPYAVSHVHNCLLTPKGAPSPEAAEVDIMLREMYDTASFHILHVTPEEVRAAVAKQVLRCFRYELPDDWLELIKALPLVKSIAAGFGIQWKSRDYAFTKSALDSQISSQKAAAACAAAEQVAADSASQKSSKKKSKKRHNSPAENSPSSVTVKICTTIFSPDDIVALVPIVKDAVYESMTVEQIWETGKNQIAAGHTEEGIEFLNEAISMFEQIYGNIHPETARAYGQLAEICTGLELHSQAVRLARKSYMILERTTGSDSYESVLALSKLGMYEASNGQYVDSLKITKRVLNHWLVSCGEDHPSVITTLSSIAVMMQKLKLSEEAIKMFRKTIKLSNKTHGNDNVISGLLRFQLAQSLIAANQLQEAADQFEKAFEIFEPTVGLKDVSTREARKWAKGIHNYLSISKKQEAYLKEVQAQKAKQAKKGKHEKKFIDSSVTSDTHAKHNKKKHLQKN
ncbi:hypothetical protein FOA43_001427 [Brettanomyces nanus]|uniref:Clu domain-containing protein n=1 Tax=Eeniella nana TaxID=13502 RepID=A0A875S194_EENNA|nr:uncharacterized protein FOA43_001427 [Brettanomyces nanus]QPG74105.1 hypothetical protein FOA43_001427 [Brettanomyces nanus]